MKNYDHYFCDPNDIEGCLSQINEEGETIVSCSYISDSQQMCIVVEKRPDFKSVKKFLGVKDREEKEGGEE